MKVGPPLAERIKLAVGSALTELESDVPEDFIVNGPNRMTADPMTVSVSYQEIAHCIDGTIQKMEDAIKAALQQTPPELYGDIMLTGGGALLRGLDKRLSDKIGIPFIVAEDPLHSVALGTGIALKNINRFSFLMR